MSNNIPNNSDYSLRPPDSGRSLAVGAEVRNFIKKTHFFLWWESLYHLIYIYIILYWMHYLYFTILLFSNLILVTCKLNSFTSSWKWNTSKRKRWNRIEISWRSKNIIRLIQRWERLKRKSWEKNFKSWRRIAFRKNEEIRNYWWIRKWKNWKE